MCEQEGNQSCCSVGRDSESGSKGNSEGGGSSGSINSRSSSFRSGADTHLCSRLRQQRSALGVCSLAAPLKEHSPPMGLNLLTALARSLRLHVELLEFVQHLAHLGGGEAHLTEVVGFEAS